MPNVMSTDAAATNPHTADERAVRTAEPIIRLVDVHAAYPGSPAEALAGITLDIMPGEYLCVLGGNGSGKSTLVQIINALVAPIAGQAIIDGLDAADPTHALAIRQRVGSVFQHPEDQMVTSIVADDVAFGPENLCIPQPDIAQRVHDALADVGMLAHAHADPADLSGGQKQRVAIAGALAMHPRILLLDEPAAMLDTGGRRDIQRIVARLHSQGITVVHVTHFMDDALRADRAIVLEGGRIVLSGAPDEVFAHRETLRKLGLDMPFYLQLQERLEQLGRPCAPCATEEELLEELASSLDASDTRPDTCSSANTRASVRPDARANIPATHAQTTDATHKAADATAPANNASQRTAAIAFENVSFSYAAPAAKAQARNHGDGPVARLRHMLKRRGNRPSAAEYPWALREITARIKPGELTAVIGRTGSGKSTAVELACALKLPNAGRTTVCGIDTADLDRRRELRQSVGYVSQLPERQLFAESVRDDIAFGPGNLGLTGDELEQRAREAVSLLDLPIDPAFLQRSPFALSGGQQRSVALAGVLAMRQPVLVLDEPMAGLDPAGRSRVRRLLDQLKRNGTTIMLVTHDMDDVAELADRVIALDAGRIIASGTPAEVFAPEMQRALATVPEPARASIPEGADALAALGLPSASAFAARLSWRIHAHSGGGRPGAPKATHIAVTDPATEPRATVGTPAATGVFATAAATPPAGSDTSATSAAPILPLTLDELAHAIAHALEEVPPRGATR